jgi:tetratricopeptide (TPR) repeat protein
LTDHPGSEELAAFVRGELPAPRMREVVRHLLLPCPPCAAMLGEAMHPAIAPPPVPGGGYDAALDRALQKALMQEESLRRRQAEARRLEEILARDGMKAIPYLPMETDTLALIDALLARSWALRHDDPRQMVQLADLAVQQAQGLDSRDSGVLQRTDVLCRTWAEMGNALRVTDHYWDAWEALHRARELFGQGTGDELLDMRVTELEASLAADRRQFDDAQVKLTRVFRFHRRRRNHHLAGRALILKGLYSSYAGSTDEALQLLRQGRALLDPDRDSDLHYAAVNNELVCLIDCGRVADAKRLRTECSRELSWGKGRVTEVHLRAVDGRLAAAEGNFARAEEALREAKQGYFDLGRNHQSAIAALDLAEVLLRRGRWVEAKEKALEAIAVFQALRIDLEVYAAVIMLRECFEMRLATPALIQEIIGHLRRAEHAQAVPFPPSPVPRILDPIQSP